MTRERFAVTIILTHLVVAGLHGVAHGALAVPAGGRAGVLLVAVAVFIGPLVALAGLLAGPRITGALVLSVSMAASLVYGFLFHYVLRTPDHVASTPHGLWGDVFRFTAAIIAVLEAGGLAAGLLLTSFLFRRRVPGDGRHPPPSRPAPA